MGSIEDGARSQVYLTTNSGGTGESTGFDSKYLFVEQVWSNGTSSFAAFRGGEGSAGGFTLGTILEPLGTMHTYQISRWRSDIAKVSVFDVDSKLLHTGWLTLDNVPVDLFISLRSGSGRFDKVEVSPLPALGDMDCDGDVDFDDIGPFVLGLIDAQEFENMFGYPSSFKGDIDLDARHDFDDIAEFVALLTQPLSSRPRSVPEPSTLALAAILMAALRGVVGCGVRSS